VNAKGDRRLQQALRELASVLSATGAPWMVIGGIAVIARGVRRFTTDIDAAVRGDEIEIGKLIAALTKKRIVPRIAEAEQFARENLVLLLRHDPSGVDFDVSFAWTAFEHEAIAAATIAAFGSVKVPMAQPEDLIVFKAIAGRGRDMDDITALLALYPKLDLARVRARVRELAGAAETPELAAGLETAIAAAAAVRDVTSPPATPVARTVKSTASERVARPKKESTKRPKTRSKTSGKSGHSIPGKYRKTK
jgi:hypothetical protein